MLFQLIYASKATRLFAEVDLRILLSSSRKRNEAEGITGILVYADGSFLQVLEGPKEAVLETFERITRDTRHKRVIRLARRDTEDRSFPGWSMAFRLAQSKEVPGLQDLAKLSQPEQETVAHKLVASFARRVQDSVRAG
jgi:hypothetical protein